VPLPVGSFVATVRFYDNTLAPVIKASRCLRALRNALFPKSYVVLREGSVTLERIAESACASPGEDDGLNSMLDTEVGDPISLLGIMMDLVELFLNSVPCADV